MSGWPEEPAQNLTYPFPIMHRGKQRVRDREGGVFSVPFLGPTRDHRSPGSADGRLDSFV